MISKHLLVSQEQSDKLGKYGVLALQFLLHSKTEQEWNTPGSHKGETEKAFIMLMQNLLDKREKVAKQSQKSLLILFQNKHIEKLIRPLQTF